MIWEGHEFTRAANGVPSAVALQRLRDAARLSPHKLFGKRTSDPQIWPEAVVSNFFDK